MFIKQITIHGFKSYKEQTITETFSPHHNAVCGSNGSGKSNFFAAIRFVLNDAYSKMSPEERQALLHEGSGQQAQCAFVEIVFDNADNRLPTGFDEVVLRRTVSQKKDEFTLDKKTVTRTDVMNLLQSAGFSKSNPYYIVPQGRITALTTAKDGERLQLLKEVAGTKVYEEHRAESMKVMDETEMKKAKIEESLTFIDERLAELDEEKKDLQRYLELDREKKCCEYNIYHREQADAVSAMQELEETYRAQSAQFVAQREQVERVQQSIGAVGAELKQLKAEMKLADDEKLQLAQALDGEVRARVQLELRLKDISGSEQVDVAALSAEVAHTRDEIAQKEQRIAQALPELELIMQEESTTSARFQALQSEREALFRKQGRNTEFKTAKERDLWIAKESKRLHKLIADKESEMAALSEDIARVDQQIANKQAQCAALERAVAESRPQLEAIGARLHELRCERDAAQAKRKEQWRNEARLDSGIALVGDEIGRASRALLGSMDRATSTGLQFIEKLAASNSVPGVYGPLYELFEADEAFHTAIDVAAGSALFHVVVDSDQTASRILQMMVAEKAGRVTFMPLNRLKPSTTAYPSGDEALPLVRKLRYDARFEAAFQQVFGKTVVVPSLQVGAKVSREWQLTAITLDGDKAERKGAISGGFHDNKRSRTEIIRSLSASKKKMATATEQLQAARESIKALEQQLTRIAGEQAHLEVQQRTLREQAKAAHAAHAEELKTLQSIQKDKRAANERLAGDVAAAQQRIDVCAQDVGTELSRSFTVRDSARLKEIAKEVDETAVRLREIESKRHGVESAVVSLQSTVELSLKQRQMALEEQLERVHRPSDGAETAKLLQAAQASVDALNSRDRDVSEQLDKLVANVRARRAALDELAAQELSAVRAIEGCQQAADTFLSRRAALLQRKDESSRRIRELGALPDSFDKYRQLPAKALLKKLQAASDALKPLAHVNRRAADQHGGFVKQRDDLLVRAEELGSSAQAIRDFVAVLDQRKDAAIEHTFQQVAANFTAVFEALVPQGFAQLKMQRDDSASGLQYSGVGIDVSFVGKSAARMQQLSGGQKSLVALALIFAIQKCDPAPFYLFDEIDANLDAAYRSAVAAMVLGLSRTAQFITTTFRPELLANADKYYVVSYDGRVSSISAVDKAVAIQFVDDAER